MKLLLIITTICFFTFFKVNAQHKNNRKDFIILKESKTLSQKDEEKLTDYNFDQYRYLNLRKKIQLVNGPLIELLSLTEIKNLGIEVNTVDEKNIKSKSEEFKHESILQLNIGLGIYEAYQPK